MSFQARYQGSCPDCDERIRPGEEVEYSDAGEVVHVDCSPLFLTRTERLDREVVDLEPQPGERPCVSCFCYHHGECA